MKEFPSLEELAKQFADYNSLPLPRSIFSMDRKIIVYSGNKYCEYHYLLSEAHCAEYEKITEIAHVGGYFREYRLQGLINNREAHLVADVSMFQTYNLIQNKLIKISEPRFHIKRRDEVKLWFLE